MPSLLRTALALVVLTPTLAGLASCSQAEPSPSPTDEDAIVRGSALSLIQSFRFAPEASNLDAKRELGSLDVLWLGKGKPTARSTALLDVEPRGRRVIEAAPDVKLAATSTGFAITSSSFSRRLAAKPAKLTLPARLDAGFTVVDEGTKLGIDVKLVGATSSEGKIAETGLLVYENGFGQGRHVVHRPHAEGIEDYVVFEQRPAVEELRYEVQVPKKAGLRLVSNVLEVVDEDGAPRLRMAAPAVVEATGAQVVPTVRVEGCAVDREARLPWGRPVTAPGAEVCSVVVGWRVDNYPVVVDPAWTTTGSMKTARFGHSATLLPSGNVLVAGGLGQGGMYPTSAEVYDPATGTWTSGGTLATARYGHTATALASGKVLVAGGQGSWYLSSAEVYDPTTNSWTNGPDMKKVRTGHTATTLAGGKVLVAGGYDGNTAFASAEVYDPASNTWTSVGNMATARRYHTATVLPLGNVLVAGGYDGNTAFASAEVYDPVGNTWSSGGNMTTARRWHTATALALGKVLIAGGNGQGNTILASSEVYDPTSNTWTSGSNMKTVRYLHTATVLPLGNVLVAGGYDGNTAFASAEVYDPATGKWTSADTLATARYWYTATLLVSGKVLVAGGLSYEPLNSAEVWGSAVPGVACSTGTTCGSGNCVDGVCCDTLCNGPCMACSQAKTGQSDGTCAPVKADTDPDNECNSQGAGVCQTSGMCDGNGACATKAGTECAAATCSGFATLTNPGTCDATGTCAVPATTDCAPFACKGTACLSSCADSTDCAQGNVCIGGQCQDPKGNGKDCTANDDCKSGNCVDGVCCNDKCTGQCEACDLPNKEGLCLPIPKGDSPHNVKSGARLACKGAADSPCAGVCDGSTASTCVYPGPAIHCGDLCEQDSFVAGLCDSSGGCVKQKGMPCAPYTCDLDVKGCKTSCETSADCAAGNVCNAVTKTCGPATSTCVDATHVKGTSGQIETCPAGYTCSSATGMCNTKCSTSAECDTASGYKCEGSECKKDSGAGGAGGAGAGGNTTAGAGGSDAGGSGGSTAAGTGGASAAGTGGGGGNTTAGDAPAEVSDEGGCGCEVPRSSRSTTWPSLAVAGLVLASLRRRSRRR